mgnify:FL=1
MLTKPQIYNASSYIAGAAVTCHGKMERNRLVSILVGFVEVLDEGLERDKFIASVLVKEQKMRRLA